MSMRSILITCCGLASGIFAAVGVNQMQNKKPDTQIVGPPLTKVLTVKSRIERGYAIKSDMVELKDWPVDLVPSTALQSLKEAEGRIALMALTPGEPIMQAKLAAPGASRGAGNLVQQGMRAYSILTTSAASSVAGLVLPGDHVDVVLSIQSSTADATGGGTSTTLLQNVEILAINHELEAPEDSRSDPKLTTVTLLVTQRQANLLGLGQKAGVLSLSLRNPEDEDVAQTDPVTLAEVRFREEPNLLQAKGTDGGQAETKLSATTTETKKPRTSSIRTMRGSQSGFVSVELGGDDR
jgi:pilus assembly protein CpaB